MKENTTQEIVIEPEVITLASQELGFPNLIDPPISRENYIDTLEEILEVNRVLILEGQLGIGKTYLMAEFVKKHNQRAFHLFLDQYDINNYNQRELIIRLCRQMELVLYKDKIEDIWINSNYFYELVNELGRLLKTKTDKFYFITHILRDI